MARPVVLLLALGWCLIAAQDARAQTGAHLERVTPALADDRLACRLQTRGLPDEKQLKSMQSGLVASVELDVVLVDGEDQALGGGSLSLRLAFDLWDEVYTLAVDGREIRFVTLPDLQAHLSDLAGPVVAPATALDDAGRYRLLALMVVNAIAPDERERVAAVIAGQRPQAREGQDQQEASVSLGHLIRLFYRGGSRDANAQELVSDWFTGKEFSDAAH